MSVSNGIQLILVMMFAYFVSANDQTKIPINRVRKQRNTMVIRSFIYCGQLFSNKRGGSRFSMKNGVVTAISLVFLCACAASSPQGSVPSECTASKHILYEFVEPIPSHLNNQQAREAVMMSLKGSGVVPGWANTPFAGEWRYEYQEDRAIYAGLTIRSHYLRSAIMFDGKAAKSVICDSRNLDQGPRSIHRNVPTWKAVLDDNIRIAMRQAAEHYETPSFDASNDKSRIQTTHLNALYESGILTKKEYEEFKQRITND